MSDSVFSTYCAIVDAIENPTPAQKIRNAATAAAEEADPFIIPPSKSNVPYKPYDTPNPVKDLAVLEAVENRLALLEGQHGVPLIVNDRLETLRGMVRSGLSRRACIERIIAYYTERLP
ncbi:MAG: hypothetical protein CVU73_14750 [Deltaproteobacteria bacterium HGW-Deltaproteobacteria-8]|jgi:hypothetical protein|nr:MAG: hypothetical protein CVU73_14750 [Deltaproteobacteria bacterium HGW-Deltaproteobacteria-8]